MAELSLTDEQQARLEAVREDLEEAFVDSYGHVRFEDALEYLLDTYTPPDEREDSLDAYDRIATAEYPDLQRVASDVPGVPGSGIDADEMRGKLLAELGPEEFAASLVADEGEDTFSGEKADDGSVKDDSSPATTDEKSSGGLLSAANQLLEEHADKWRESDGDAPYEVDLPDGSTEQARTKDDVRQFLFRHY